MTATIPAVRERPILFSGPMVCAILEGRKTQTRRIVQKVGRDNCLPDRRVQSAFGAVVHVSKAAGLCPYGQPGDRLWVREAWALMNDGGWAVHPSTLEYRADRQQRLVRPKELLAHSDDTGSHAWEPRSAWRPSIHMPRWVSRLDLEITDIRVERLNDCTEADAIAEGVERRDEWWLGAKHPVKGTAKVFNTALQAFASRWDDLNIARGFGWAVNPWVWVIGFKRVEG